MKPIHSISLALLFALAACGEKKDEEVSPGAAAAYLDNVSANSPDPHPKSAKPATSQDTPASGQPDDTIGQAPVFSREAVPPRK